MKKDLERLEGKYVKIVTERGCEHTGKAEKYDEKGLIFSDLFVPEEDIKDYELVNKDYRPVNKEKYRLDRLVKKINNMPDEKISDEDALKLVRAVSAKVEQGEFEEIGEDMIRACEKAGILMREPRRL